MFNFEYAANFVITRKPPSLHPKNIEKKKTSTPDFEGPPVKYSRKNGRLRECKLFCVN